MSADLDQSSASSDTDWIYAGFWIRVWAAVIDSALLLIVVFPILAWLVPDAGSRSLDTGSLVTPDGRIDYQAFSAVGTLLPGPAHILLYWVLPAVVVVIFWLTREATPGKMAIHARIVDARTGTTPATRQLLIRYLGYYVATLPCLLGLIWVGIDARKQGWHDKLAGTVVIRPRRVVEASARFEAPPSAEREARNEGWKNEP